MAGETYGPRTQAWQSLTQHASALQAGSIAELFRADPRRALSLLVRADIMRAFR